MNIISGNSENKTGPTPKGKFSGSYQKGPGRLTRISDGQVLQYVERPVSQVTPTKTQFYLVDGTDPARSYVSSLYGNEFEYERQRYRIEQTDVAGIYRVHVIRQVRPRKERGTRRRAGL